MLASLAWSIMHAAHAGQDGHRVRFRDAARASLSTCVLGFLQAINLEADSVLAAAVAARQLAATRVWGLDASASLLRLLSPLTATAVVTTLAAVAVSNAVVDVAQRDSVPGAGAAPCMQLRDSWVRLFDAVVAAAARARVAGGSTRPHTAFLAACVTGADCTWLAGLDGGTSGGGGSSRLMSLLGEDDECSAPFSLVVRVSLVTKVEPGMASAATALARIVVETLVGFVAAAEFPASAGGHRAASLVSAVRAMSLIHALACASTPARDIVRTAFVVEAVAAVMSRYGMRVACVYVSHSLCVQVWY